MSRTPEHLKRHKYQVAFLRQGKFKHGEWSLGNTFSTRALAEADAKERMAMMGDCFAYRLLPLIKPNRSA